MAAIYHTVFVAEEVLSFTQVVENSGLSKASASTGLKLLERMLAVEVVHIPNDRNSYYRPELSLRRVAAGFIQQTLLPGLEAGGRVLEAAPGDDEAQLSEHLQGRLSSLQSWHATSRDLFPMLAALGNLEVPD